METYKNNRQLVLHFLKGSKRFFALSLTFATLVSLFDMISPKIISFTVDSVIGDKAPEVPRIAELLIERLGGIGHALDGAHQVACEEEAEHRRQEDGDDGGQDHGLVGLVAEFLIGCA
jgi:ABC-type multidrug transport system fused ATPase/permease subunit